MSSEDKPDVSTVKVVMTGDEVPGPDRPAPSNEALMAGRYRVVRRLGKGGMGEVMAARDEQVGRDVAIKRMRAANPSERAIQRFLREARVQGRLEHPAIVPVHEIGRDTDELPYFVMKRVTGESLAKVLGERDPKSVQRMLRAFADVCLAIEFAHSHGIVHRDLKPDNIMLGPFGEVYVVDWGVAKVVGDDDGEFHDLGTGSGEHATGTGVAIGTPGYMSPEQVRGLRDLDGRADVYTLGCLLFEILSGEPLHPRGHAGLRAALEGCDARPSLRAPDRDIPPELDALCVHATHLAPADRVATARELGERVQRYLDGDRDLALRRDLARGHFESARGAFEAGDREDNRRLAMREAAAALALDPTLVGAAALVGRLMLEPPRETPREVAAAIVDDDVRSARAIARAGIWAVAGALPILPMLWWIAPAGSLYPAVLGGLLVLDLFVAIHAMRAPTPRPGLVAIANTLIVIVLARMYSPVLIAPGIAASLAMAMVLTPRFSWLGSAPGICVLMGGAVLGPLALEQLGVLSTTMSVTDGAVAFHAPAIAGLEGPTIVVASIYILSLIAGACIAAAAMRAQTRAAHHRLQLQAWQLRQLVPAG
jgi:serine/threonine-protein kinase